jgi:N-methylhydantoinase B
MHVALNAAEAMMQCVRLALWATSPMVMAGDLIHGWGGSPALGLTMWSGIGFDDIADTWIMMDGNWPGASAGNDRDGLDLAGAPVGMESPPSSADIEVLESWYPMLLHERRVRPGVNGAGEHRSGGGAQVTLQPYGTTELTGQMLGMREWLPLEGAAGGFPGETTRFSLFRSDGTVEQISTEAAGVVLKADEVFEFACGSAGGVGDPVGRDPEAVAEDVEAGLLPVDAAGSIYGVVFDGGGRPDAAATATRRAEILADRLARARPPGRAVTAADVVGLSEGHEEMPLYPGVVHRGAVAYAQVSDTALAIAPDHWTDGCAVLEDRRPGPGPDVTIRAYLDPSTGHSLFVEAVPAGETRAFEVSPSRWTTIVPAI